MSSAGSNISDWFHSGYRQKVMRDWQSNDCYNLSPSIFMYPIFICDDVNGKEAITSLGDQCRWGINRLSELLNPLIENGLQSVLIFGVPGNITKDAYGTCALSLKSPVVLAIKRIKELYPSLIVCADVCLCAYTNHGHCGILDDHGYIDNVRSIERIAQLALQYAINGADIVAPSDMMDGRTAAIKLKLFENGLHSKCAVMSYSTKYCSTFYGPFRDACHSAPKENTENVTDVGTDAILMPSCKCSIKNRSTYQLPPGSRALGIRASLRCMKEGADFLMIKPGLPYLDMIRDVKNATNDCIPIAVYQVSGEYAMLWHAANTGAFDLKEAVLETCYAFRRAGVQIIISYYTPKILEWIKEDFQAKYYPKQSKL